MSTDNISTDTDKKHADLGQSDSQTDLGNAGRFLGRAKAYAVARPGYPAALGEWIGEWLKQEGKDGTVVDIGAGTGLFTRLLLQHSTRRQVIALEPNPEMRAQLAGSLTENLAAERLLVQGGSAEATGLPDHSVKLLTAAQAAHWFDPAPTVQEWRRILRPDGRILLVWNDWRGEWQPSEAPFNLAYRDVIARLSAQRGTPAVQQRVPTNRLPLLMPGGFEERVFRHDLRLSRERLYALAGSISYLPAPGDPDFAELCRLLDGAFDAHKQQGEVTLAYRTYAFLGQIEPSY